jgi:hypothetical protein
VVEELDVPDVPDPKDGRLPKLPEDDRPLLLPLQRGVDVLRDDPE